MVMLLKVLVHTDRFIDTDTCKTSMVAIFDKWGAYSFSSLFILDVTT